jgi:hypothetical protein
MKLSLKIALVAITMGLSSMTYAQADNDPKVLEAEQKLLDAEHKAADDDHEAAFKNGKIDHAVHHEHKARKGHLNAHKGKKHKSLKELRAARVDVKKHHDHVKHHVSTSTGACHKDVHTAAKALGDDHAAHDDVIKAHPEHGKAHREGRDKHAIRVAHLNKGKHTHDECEKIHAGVKDSHKNHHVRHGHGKTHAAAKKPA